MKNEFDPGVLRKLRKSRKMTLLSVGLRFGCAPSHLCSIETGRYKPSIDFLIDLCNFYGIPVSDVFSIK